MKTSRAQYTTEYVIVLGIAMTIIASALFYSLYFYTSYFSSSTSNQLSTAATQLVKAADYVSAQGINSKTLIAVTFPTLTVTSSFFCGQLVQIDSGHSSYIDRANVNISGLMPFNSGLYHAYVVYNGSMADVGINLPLSLVTGTFSYSSGSILYGINFLDRNGNSLPSVNFNISVYSGSGVYLASGTGTTSSSTYTGLISVPSGQSVYVIRIFPSTYQEFFSTCVFA